LIASPSSGGDPVTTLDSYRYQFFCETHMSSDIYGLRRLIAKAVDAINEDADWLMELGDLDLNEAQTLLSFTMDCIADQDGDLDVTEIIYGRLHELPSLQQLPVDELWAAAQVMGKIASDIREHCGDDPVLCAALRRTGMPIELLNIFLSRIREDPFIHLSNPESKTAWIDSVVHSALEQCSSRKWFTRLMHSGRWKLNSIFPAVQMWRTGASVVEIEEAWPAEDHFNSIRIGEFINQRVSQFAQLWGALSVCFEAHNESIGIRIDDRTFRYAQTYVREGVSDLGQLAWLYGHGKLDRVLAHRLAGTVRIQGNR